MSASETPPHEHGEAPEARPYRPSMVFLLVVTFVAAAADLASKGWAKATLSVVEKGKPTKHFVVIKDHFDFIYTLNPGGAWSFLRSLPENLRRPFFLFVSSAAIVFIVSVYRRVHREQWAMRWGLPLALGGAIGNLVDRIRYGSVIDFIDMYTVKAGREIHWPTYNVADIAIVVGVVLMGLDTFLSRKLPLSDHGDAAASPPPASSSLPSPPLPAALPDPPPQILEATPKD